MKTTTMSALADVSESTFPTQVLASDKPVLVDFWAPWCGPCKMLSPVVEKVAGQLGSRVSFVKLNTDENPQIAGNYQVSGIPCLILFKGGEPVARLVGAKPKGALLQELSAYL